MNMVVLGTERTNLGTDHSESFTLGRIDFPRHDAAARLILRQF